MIKDPGGVSVSVCLSLSLMEEIKSGAQTEAGGRDELAAIVQCGR